MGVIFILSGFICFIRSSKKLKMRVLERLTLFTISALKHSPSKRTKSIKGKGSGSGQNHSSLPTPKPVQQDGTYPAS